MTHELLQFFKFSHLPTFLQGASAPFCHLAEKIVEVKKEEFQDIVPTLLQGLADDINLKSPRTLEVRWCVSKLETAANVAAAGLVSCNDSCLDFVLRLLLEAKDCAVRAVLYVPPKDEP